MRIPRSLSLAAICAVLAVGSIAFPAAAADPRLAFVNGMPDSTVDVCIGNREVRSALRYGRWFETTVAPGDRVVRFRVASAGRCKGTTLARRTLPLEADVDRTVVVTAEKPGKVLVFNNKSAPAPVGNVNWVGVRHAADVGSAVITQQVGFVLPAAAPDPFTKGGMWADTYGLGEHPMLFSAYRPKKATPFVGPNEYLTYPGRRLEIILVGTKPSNARFVAVVRPTIAP